MNTSTVSLLGQLSDISLGGCYVEMMRPLPSGTEIEIILLVERLRVTAKGRICAAREGFGMGIAFTELGHRNQKNLIELVEWVSQALPRGTDQLASHSGRSESEFVGLDGPRPFFLARALKAVLRRLIHKG